MRPAPERFMNFSESSSFLRKPPAAVPLNKGVGDNALGGRQVRVFDVIDELGGSLCAELEGVHVDGGQLGRSEPCKQ